MLKTFHRMIKDQLRMRNFAAISMCAVLLGCIGFVILCSDDQHVMLVASERAPSVEVIGKIPAHNARDFYFSSNSRYLIVPQTGGGGVALFDGTGSAIYEAKIPSINRLALAPDGSRAIAYSHKNPAKQTVFFLDGKGNVEWKLDVSGAVWSADACRFEDGVRFVIGTGDKYIYIADISDKRKRYERWRAPGALVSLNIDAGGKVITLGTWQRSSVVRAGVDGETIWELEANSVCLPSVEMLAVPARMLVRSIPNRLGMDGAFVLISDSGDTIWQGALRAAEKANVFPSPTGRNVCIGFEKRIEHGGKTVAEKHVALFDSAGRRLCEKGSLFFQAEPLAITSKGNVLLTDGKANIFAMDKTGELKKILGLPAKVKDSAYSRDGRRLAVKCLDGYIYILRINP